MISLNSGARILLSALAILCFSAPGSAQNPPNSPAKPDEQQQPPDTTANTQADTNQSPASTTPGYPLDTQIHPAGKAIPWYGTSSPLKWWDFSIGDFTYDHIYDRLHPFDQVPSADLNLDVFRTSIIFDHPLKNGQGIVLQYIPQLAILNGDVAGNGGFNNTLALGTVFQLSPRFAISLNNGFTQVHSRQLYPPDVLAVDEQAGNLIQNNYLQNAGSYWSDTVTVTGTYKMTPRLLLTVAPAYNYTDVTNQNGVNYVANGQTIAGKASLIYSLTPRQNIGGVFDYETLRATGVAHAAGTDFESLGLYYGYQVSKTWWFRGDIGYQQTIYGGGLLPLRTVGGGGSVVKAFANSTLALAYERGRADTNFVTPDIGNRADAVYTLHLTTRFTYTMGAGIYRETGIDPQNKASYASGGIAFALARSLFLDSSYTYTFQRSSTQQLLSGIRNTFVVGLRWDPKAMVVAH